MRRPGAPTFEFRTHSQGHFLSAWAQAWAVTGETIFRDRAAYMVANRRSARRRRHRPASAGECPTTVSTRRSPPARRLAVLRQHQARDVLLRLAGWVDWRTGRLTYAQMQTTMRIEFGGMNAVLTDLYQQTGDARWWTVAQRFDHAAVIDPLANNVDQLNGLHANTQIPKIAGCAREYKATGTARYRTIADNFWNIVTGAHS